MRIPNFFEQPGDGMVKVFVATQVPFVTFPLKKTTTKTHFVKSL
jgi:hypothetical protein